MTEGQADRQERRQRSETSALEWIAAAIGGLILLGMLGLIGAQALEPAVDEPPQIHVRAGPIQRAGDHYLVEVTATNPSGQAAGSVEIEGELKQGEEAVETSGATIAFVPGHSEREAGLLFTRDPRGLTLEVRAKGYELP